VSSGQSKTAGDGEPDWIGIAARYDGRMISERLMSLDRAGVLVSVGCAIHCTAMPFAAGVLSIAGVGFFASEAAETTMLAAAAVIAVVSLTSGCCHHRQWRPIALMLLGFGLVAFGKWWAPEGWREVSVVAGAVTIASAHLVNLRACALSRLG
jgi:hypothetical protein